MKTFVDRVTKLAIYSRACWDYKREEHVCLACPCLSSESSLSHRSWYTVCAPYLLVNENKWIPLLLMLHFQDCRVSSFRLTLSLFCFMLKSWEISIPAYSWSPHTASFHLYPGHLWYVHCRDTVSPLTILSDYFSNNNFLKAEDLFFSQIICSLLLCYYKFNLFYVGDSPHFPLPQQVISQWQTLFPYSCLIHRSSIGPGTFRCPITVINVNKKVNTFIGGTFLAKKNCLWLLDNSGLTAFI